jgi:CheY-like chemotaxis protein
MIDAIDTRLDTTPSASFVQQVQQVLDHLHDFPYLMTHPLAQRVTSLAEQGGESSAQHLRREVIQAIELMSPGPGVSFRAPHARLYNVLHLHYVEGMTVQEAARELNVSLRQAYRDLRHGEESVASVLWHKLAQNVNAQQQVEQTPSATIADRSERETALDTHAIPVNLQELLERARNAVTRLCKSRAVTLEAMLPSTPVVVLADAVAAQQVLVGLLSYAIQQAAPGPFHLQLSEEDTAVTLLLTYPVAAPTDEVGPSPEPDQMIEKMVGRLGWSLAETGMQGERDMPGPRTLTLRMPVGGHTLLVIDDNEVLVGLFERYLAGLPFRVLQANHGRRGIELAIRIKPDVIVLDVMMPEIDGWQVLQTLQTLPETQHIPVVVSSVINDPQLATSLGAARYLPKPFGRKELLGVLRELVLL